MRKYIDIVLESIDTGQALSAQDIRDKHTRVEKADGAAVGDTIEDAKGEQFVVLSRDNDVVKLRRVRDNKVGQSALSYGYKVVKKGIKEAFDDFKDPMFDKEHDDNAEQAENDFQMFKDEGEVGAPDTAKPQESDKAEGEDNDACEGDDCEEIGKSLNAKDMKAFVGGYKKLCAGAVESISVEEAKELAEIMLALFKSKVEENPIEESNQDNKVAREAEAAGKPVPENPNAPKKPMTAADKHAANAAAAEQPKVAPTGPKPAPSEAKKTDQQAQEAGAEEAKQFVKKKIG